MQLSNYINIFSKGYKSNWSKEMTVIKEVKNTSPWTYDVIEDLKGDCIVGNFYKLPRHKLEFITKKVLK